ncbi:unnamed protein product [Heligmosomoides polygyrus]|uniref:F5/8 type C domain-containing protein n=1 Tax=Heligmosomoides polygyrus TaxID=6339 RepID=A0A183FU12_HELPZ|nr:unnamed protein product [Heligmosomoides polygyrus]
MTNSAHRRLSTPRAPGLSTPEGLKTPQCPQRRESRASRARTHTGSGAWCPLHQVNSTHKEWIQITFGRDTVVSAVEVQGRFDEGRGMEFARAFKIEYWRPKLRGWASYKDEEGSEVSVGRVKP